METDTECLALENIWQGQEDLRCVSQPRPALVSDRSKPRHTLRCGQQMACLCGLRVSQAPVGPQRQNKQQTRVLLPPGGRKGQGKACAFRPQSQSRVSLTAPPIPLQICLSNVQEAASAGEEACLPRLPFWLTTCFLPFGSSFLSFLFMHSIFTPLPSSTREGSQGFLVSYYAL